MKQSTNWLGLLMLLLLCNVGAAQTPGGINYQGVARNQFLVGLNNDSIQLRFTVRELTAVGPVLYTETRGTRTDSFGVFNVVIGASNAISQSGNIKLVPWSDTTKKFLMVELNILDPNTPGFLNMGTTQLLSVPFSFYSDISDSSRIAAKADSAKFSNGSGRYFFSASLNLYTLQNIPAGGDDDTYNYTLQFPVVNHNESGVFNPATSLFTAPDSGIYQFDVNLYLEYLLQGEQDTSQAFVEMNFALFRNSQVVNILHKYDTYDPSYNSEGFGNFHRSVRIKLAKGDTVMVKTACNFNGFNSVALGLAIEEGNIPLFLSYYDPIAMAEFSGYKIK